METVAAKSRASKNFAANVRSVLEEKGISQRELARRMKTASLGFLSDVLCGRSACTLDTAQRIADALNEPLANLLADAVAV